MKISVIGTGYVGLVSGACLADKGHQVTCIDIDQSKIEQLKLGYSPIYEPGLDELIQKNLSNKSLFFTTDFETGIQESAIVMVAVGTPSNNDGTVNLTFIEQVATQIGQTLKHDAVIVTKSTVPVGTNERIKEIVNQHIFPRQIEVVSCPEFLREGSAIYDTFHGERIVIGAHSPDAALVVEKAFAPFQIPFVHTDIRSAEMIKYAANAFLATKISFMNEIANLCEKVGANVEEVALGMGKDSRIGERFLNAGIGYGGSCFPKDTRGLHSLAQESGYEFNILHSVIEVNERQQLTLVKKVETFFETLKDKTVAILGLSFKPNTDDIRDAPSLKVIDYLLHENCKIRAYDPIAVENVRKLYNNKEITFTKSYQEALRQADCALILTEWQEFKAMDLKEASDLLQTPIIFDGRNCFDLEIMKAHNFTYVSVGRPAVIRHNHLLKEVSMNET